MRLLSCEFSDLSVLANGAQHVLDLTSIAITSYSLQVVLEIKGETQLLNLAEKLAAAGARRSIYVHHVALPILMHQFKCHLELYHRSASPVPFRSFLYLYPLVTGVLLSVSSLSFGMSRNFIQVVDRAARKLPHLPGYPASTQVADEPILQEAQTLQGNMNWRHGC